MTCQAHNTPPRATPLRLHAAIQPTGGLLQPLRQFLPRLLRGTLGVTVLMLSTACAQLPARPPVQATVSDGELARQVTVLDRGGAVSQATEDRVLEAVKAEGQPDLAEHHLRVLAGSGDVDLYRGNSVRLLVDGPATFTAMKAAIQRARGRVLLESYIVEDSKMADELAVLLTRKVAQGVEVAMLFDGLGSHGIDAAYLERLGAAGVAVCKFNPVNPLERPGYWSINHRDHRKVLVVDQDWAFTGGINISRVYASGSFSRSRGGDNGDALKSGWRDTHIELRGPVVQAFGRGFMQVWASQGCPRELRKAPPPPTAAAPGQRVVKVIESDPRDPQNRIYTSLLAAIDASQRNIYLTMAYFAPGTDMVNALAQAARRGVEVVLVLPGRSDFTLVLHAGRAYYDQLLSAGVRIHEMDDAVMHAKTAVIDGVFSTVGSSNMDWRSFVANNEINAIVLGREFGQELEKLFRQDLSNSRAVELDGWRQRGWSQRVMEQVGRFAERFL